MRIGRTRYIFAMMLASYVGQLEGLLFAQRISTNLPVYQQTFRYLSSKQLKDAVECAAWINQQNKVATSRSLRASGFFYNSTNSTCIIGRTLVYNDIYMDGSLTAGDRSDAYILLGKPLASVVNKDTWFYALLNEEQSEYYSHPNFMNTIPSGYTPSWGNFAYTILSPVITYGGQYAVTFNGLANLKFAVPPPGSVTLTEFTILVWYNRGSFNPSGAMVAFCYPNYYSTEFWINQPSMTPFTLFGTWYGGPSIKSSAVVPLNTWSYLGFTYSKSAHSMAFWINGTQYAATIASGPSVDPPAFTEVVIGQNCGGDYMLTGTIASVEIYNRALGQVEIASAMAKSFTGRTSTDQLPL